MGNCQEKNAVIICLKVLGNLEYLLSFRDFWLQDIFQTPEYLILKPISTSPINLIYYFISHILSRSNTEELAVTWMPYYTSDLNFFSYAGLHD